MHDLGVVLMDGEAEVTDKATADGLRGLPAEYGVRTGGGRAGQGTAPGLTTKGMVAPESSLQDHRARRNGGWHWGVNPVRRSGEFSPCWDGRHAISAPWPSCCSRSPCAYGRRTTLNEPLTGC